MAKPLIITVRVNEYAMSEGNPSIPYTPQEIADTAAECRAAGASLIHFHARNRDGTPCHAPETYAVNMVYLNSTETRLFLARGMTPAGV